MLAYIARRLMLLPLILFGVTILIFIMLQFMNPYARLKLYVRSPAELKGGTDQLDRLLVKYGLNDPFWVQYGHWLEQVAQGNLGWSETAKTSVLDAIQNRFPATAELTLYAIVPLVFFAIWMGVAAAVRHNLWADQFLRFITVIGTSLPIFVLGLFLLMICYGLLYRHLPSLFEGWFAPGRLSEWAQAAVRDSKQFNSITGMVTIDAILNGQWRIFWDALGHLILPVVGLSFSGWAYLQRVMRSSMLETLRQDYVTTARAKGLPEKRVIVKHARRNALIPIVTLVGFTVIGLLGGVIITETIFNYPGLGNWTAAAAIQLDIPSVLGYVLFATTLLILINLIVDLLYTVIDPRVRLI
ncbi:ABC transporter permease [Candidatus Acetothermia bacterium]|nr:ABC transporter permease [Candidatus Acetothermia bacterium]MBI3660198.1 ABC transporter permease [Candidatus Acetothermia bacterium]